MKPNALAYIGLGSNLNNPKQQVQQAIEEIGELSEVTLEAQSSLYEYPPYGPVQDQANFINAVVAVCTSLSPHALLQQLLSIEQRHGRKRKQHWGPRTLDLDLLLYDQQQMISPDLILPHPHLKRRHFVVYPLAEINPSLILPEGESIQQLLQQLSAEA